MREWVEAATTDADIIRNWYTHLYADHGVGLAMGRQPDGRFVFALDADEHDPSHSGSETLHDLQAEHGKLPDTPCSITGSGGLHLLFTAPAGVEVRNGIAGDGLDVRGEGGQIVVAPSLHPLTNRRYEWEDTYAPWDRDIAQAPDWLLEIVRLPASPGTDGLAGFPPSAPTPPATPVVFNTPDSPAEWLRSQWDWPLQLRDAGWTEHHTARNGDVHWTRPGKDRREGESAILHMPDGPFVVFSTDASVTGLHNVGHVNRDGSVSVSPFQFYAVHRHGGDLSAAARAINGLMPGGAPDTRLSTPDPPPDDLDGYTAQALDWHRFWTDDHSGQDWVAEPLIPAGRLTVMYAPAKMGKSEITLAVVAALATGRPILGQRNDRGPRHVVYLDYEMTRADLAERLEQLGYDEQTDLSHLHYYLLPSLPALDTAQGASVMRLIAAYHHAEAVVIDTMGRAVEGDENSNDTYRAFARHTGLGLKADGVAVVRTDHAGKDRDKGQRGASAKNDDADVVFRVDRVEGGWRLLRTHTRVNWIPDVVVIDRVELADGALRIELAQSAVTYVVDTGKYVDELRAAGVTIDHSTSVSQLTAAAKALGISRKTKMMASALKWMKTQLTDYDGPTPIEPTAPAADTRLSVEPDQPDDDDDADRLRLDDVR